jgi:hypothetical protein
VSSRYAVWLCGVKCLRGDSLNVTGNSCHRDIWLWCYVLFVCMPQLFPVNEIVYYGIAPGEQLGPGGVHLEPADYHKKLGQDNTVVIDVRNNYECEIGRFQKVMVLCVIDAQADV